MSEMIYSPGLPPGAEIAYGTADTTTITGTTGATATTVITLAAVLCSGNQRLKFEFFCSHCRTGTAGTCYTTLYEDGTQVTGATGGPEVSASVNIGQVLKAEMFRTPAAGFRTWSMRAYANPNATMYGATDGFQPIFFRVTVA